MEILPYSSEHHDGVVALWREAFPNEPPRNEPDSVISAKLAVQPELFFVAVQSGQVIGTALSGFDGHRGWVYKVAVGLVHRRKGIGRALMKHVEETLISLGCVKLNLQIRATNREVESFYRALGYETEDRISMGRPLAATGNTPG